MNRDNGYLIGNQFAKGHKPNRTSFKKGFIPWNKNRKGIHLSRKSEFKKGNKPVNHLTVGSLVVRIDKNKAPRRWIKISEPNKWQLYSVWLWEYLYGIVPSGFLVHHKNGLSLDDRPENLELLSRKEHIQAHREQLRAGKRFHLKVQTILYPQETASRCLSGYEMIPEIIKIRQGQKALFESA
ncbi:MAG: HNH endonuclease signature motif containing protein [Bacilli bacterium]